MHFPAWPYRTCSTASVPRTSGTRGRKCIGDARTFLQRRLRASMPCNCCIARACCWLRSCVRILCTHVRPRPVSIARRCTRFWVCFRGTRDTLPPRGAACATLPSQCSLRARPATAKLSLRCVLSDRVQHRMVLSDRVQHRACGGQPRFCLHTLFESTFVFFGDS